LQRSTAHCCSPATAPCNTTTPPVSHNSTTCTCTQKNYARTYLYIHTYMHMCAYKCVYMQVHAYACIYMHACMQTCVHAYTQTYLYTYTHIHIHTNMHKDIHTKKTRKYILTHLTTLYMSPVTSRPQALTHSHEFPHTKSKNTHSEV